MKKMILTLAIAISSISVFATEENVNQKVLDAFNTEFSTASDVVWTVSENYYKASFVYNENYVFAYFSEDGEMLGISRYISPGNLPISLQANLKKSYEKFWISDLYEVSKNEQTYYYITLENADSRLVLRSGNGSSWSVYHKEWKS